MSKENDNLGDRMKQYENCYKHVLSSRLPIICRLDGRAFHTYTKGLKKVPGVAYDQNLESVMDMTAIKLCEEIQGSQLAYVQSDEISILIHGYKRLTSQGWFNNEIQKMVSVSAAIASATFTANSNVIWGKTKPAYFDSRVFVLPEHEVINAFIWRQQDAIRNSIQMLARSLFSHKECDRKNGAELKEMCLQKGRNWDNEPTCFKHGRVIIKMPEEFTIPSGQKITRMRWSVDKEIPVFSQNREYVEKHLAVEKE